MILHCLYDPGSRNAQRLRSLARDGEAILLVGSAVALARRGHPALEEWATTGATLYALAEDLQLFGIAATDGRVEIVDYPGWAALAAQQSKQLLWR